MFQFNKNKILLTKYNPISINYYHINELCNKYNIFNKFNINDDTILTIGSKASKLIDFPKFGFNSKRWSEL